VNELAMQLVNLASQHVIDKAGGAPGLRWRIATA
jgi:hypothetical protein